MRRGPTLSVRCLVLALALVAPGAASAALITYGFTATLATVDDPGDVFGGQLGPGSLITGSYTFESTTPDAEPADPTLGSYDGALDSATLTLGTSVLTLGAAGSTSNTMFFVNDIDLSGTPVDGYAPFWVTPTAALDGTPIVFGGMLVYLASSDTTINASDATQTTQPNAGAAAFDQLNLVQIQGNVSGSIFTLSGSVSDLPVTTPEPGTGLLLGLGVTALAAARRELRAR